MICSCVFCSGVHGQRGSIYGDLYTDEAQASLRWLAQQWARAEIDRDHRPDGARSAEEEAVSDQQGGMLHVFQYREGGPGVGSEPIGFFISACPAPRGLMHWRAELVNDGMKACLDASDEAQLMKEIWAFVAGMTLALEAKKPSGWA